MTTSLTIYHSGAASSTLSTANKLYVTTGTPSTSQSLTQIDASTGWGEIYAQGHTGVWPAAGAIGAPSGNGFFLDGSTLDGQAFALANWSGSSRISVNNAGTVSGTLVVRAYKYSSGVYTNIVTFTVTSLALTSTIANQTLASTAGSAMSFATGERLYIDYWFNCTSNTSSAGQTLRMNRLSTDSIGFTGDPFTNIITPGYNPAGTAVLRDIVSRFRLLSTAAKDAQARFRTSANAPQSKNALSRFKLKSAVSGHDAQARFLSVIGTPRKKDVPLRFTLALPIPGVSVYVSNQPVMVLEGSFEIDDSINSISTCTFTIRDDSGLNHYHFGQPVQVVDSIKGLYYTGFIATAVETNIRPNPLIFTQVACRDLHAIPERRTYQGAEYTNQYTGVAASDMLNTLHADGITAQYATRRETTQTDFSAGTLTNTSAAANAGDGDLELALAGVQLQQVEASAADFSAGTLTNVSGTSAGLVLSSSAVLKYTGVASPNIGGNLYAYTAFNTTNTAIGASYVFSYDIFIASTSPVIAAGVDFVCTDGTTLRDSGTLDTFGLNAHPGTGLDGYANDMWFHRDFPLTSLLVDFNGYTIDYVQAGFEQETAGTYTCYIDNVVLKNSGGTTVATFYSGGNPSINKLLGNQGYSAVRLSNVTAYQHTGQRISSAYSLSSVGIVKDTFMAWVTPTYTQPLASNATNYPAPVLIESSYDGGATWQTCTNNAPLPNLPTGLSTSGRTVTLRETLNLAGPDPTIAPVLTQCQFTIDPSYSATKSDAIDIDTSSGDFAAGTLTNVQYATGAGEQITGSYRAWDDGSLANQTTYGLAGGVPAVYLFNGQLALRVSNGPFEVRSRFDFAGQWQNFILEMDVQHFLDITSNLNAGIVYRCTGWQNNNDTYAYVVQLEAASIALARGTNSSSGAGAATLIQRTTVAFEAGKYYHVKIVVNGSSHQVYVNDILYINATDATFSAAGYVGARLYNNAAARWSVYFDNFGIMSSAFVGTRVHPSLSLNSLGSVYGSMIQWNATVPGNTDLLVESSINGGSTWATCTSGAVIPQLTNGTNVSGVSLLIRETFTTQSANTTPTLAGISVFVLGGYSSSGTRVSPALSLSTIGRLGSSIVAWNATLPASTTLGVDTSIDGGVWTDVSGSNGTPIPGLAVQPVATQDAYTANTSANYTNTFHVGGSVATVTYDLINTRLTLAGGVTALYVWNSVTGVGDFDLIFDMDESDAGGTVWHYADSNNYYQVIVNDASSSSGTTNKITLYKTSGGTRTSLANATIAFVRGTYKRFKVTMQSGVILIAMDGIQALTYTDVSPLASGKTGLSNDTGTSRFYLIRVQPYGDIVTAHTIQMRLRLASTDPTVTPQVLDTTLATFGNTIQPGALIPQTDYKNHYLSDNFDDMVKQSSVSGGQWWWNIDKNRIFSMLPNTGLPAPWIASDNPGDFLDPGLTITDQSDLYRNRQTITNVMRTTTISESRMGDGVTRSWAFGYEWASAPTILVNGVSVSVGVKSVDTNKVFYYAVGDNTITQDTGLTTYTNGYTIAFSGTGQYLTSAQYDNVAEQNALAGIDGTSGIVENVEDGTGLTYTAGLALAQARVAQYGIRGKIINGGTLHDGLQVGMLIPVCLPEHNINDQLYLIRNIKTKLTSGAGAGGQYQTFWYQIEMITGPDIGGWEQLYRKQ